LETIGNDLKHVFGEEPSKLILQHATKSAMLKENSKKVEVFSEALREILGSGSVLIENLTLKSLCSKLELKFEEKKGYEFSDYIKELREKCSR